MPHMSGNIPFTVFYGFKFSEILHLERCTLIITYFISRASDLFSRMVAQSGNGATLIKK